MSDWNKIWISCKDATYLEEMRCEGKINFNGRLALWIHLLYCRFCRLFVKQSRTLSKAASEIANNTEARFTISDEKKEAMQRSLRNE